MAEVGETSSPPPPTSAAERPLVVRVKRKPSQSPVEALWLEISERPLKRALLDFEKLSLSGSSGKEQSSTRTRRVFVKHVETVSSSEDTVDVLQSFVQAGSDNGSRSRANSRARHTFRKENKQDQLLSKAKQDQEASAKSARFEQIWRSRRGNKEVVHDEELDEVCHLYDIVRVDGDGTSEKANKQEQMSKEDQESLCKFLPLLRELVPDAAEDIESDINSYVREQEAPEEFVYDLYTVGDSAEEMDVSHPFPLVQVNDDDEWHDGPDDSDYESDDSNAENNHLNDYPEETDEEVESKTSTDESEEESEEHESETGSEESTTEEDSKKWDISDDDYCDGEMDAVRHADSDDDAGDSEDWRWAYR